MMQLQVFNVKSYCCSETNFYTRLSSITTFWTENKQTPRSPWIYLTTYDGNAFAVADLLQVPARCVRPSRSVHVRVLRRRRRRISTWLGVGGNTWRRSAGDQWRDGPRTGDQWRSGPVAGRVRRGGGTRSSGPCAGGREEDCGSL